MGENKINLVIRQILSDQILKFFNLRLNFGWYTGSLFITC